VFFFFANHCQKDVFQCRLFFNVFNRCRWELTFQFGQCTTHHDSALVKDGNAVCKLLCFFQVLRGKKHCCSSCSKFFDSVPNLYARLGVKSGGWFVKKNNCCFSNQTH